jgi:hypothetical protein
MIGNDRDKNHIPFFAVPINISLARTPELIFKALVFLLVERSEQR